MLGVISYKRRRDSKLYQTSGTMTVPVDQVAAAVLHLEAGEFEVTSIKQVAEEQ